VKILLIPLLLMPCLCADSQVDCVSPKLKLPAACGVVTDMSGQPIPGARVSVGAADVGSFATTDEKGRWGFLSDEKMAGWMRVEAKGFRTAEFQYVTEGKSVQVCKRPVYIRIFVGLEGCPVVTMNAKQGIKR